MEKVSTEKIITGIKVPTSAELLAYKIKPIFGDVPEYDQLTQYVTQAEGVKGIDGIVRFGTEIHDMLPEDLENPELPM